MSNAVATQAQRPKFSAMISTPGYQKLINNTIRDPKRAQRFIASITSAVATNPALSECDPATILSGALLGESLGLSPSPQLGQYYLVPFDTTIKGKDGKTIYLYDENGNHVVDEKGKWVAAKEKKAQFVLGYKGYVQLALRSGYYKHLNVISVKAGELVSFDPLTEEVNICINTDELARENSATVGYLAMFEYLNGFKKTIYWSREKMEAHALRYSKGYAAKKGYTFWEKDFDTMAYKTMLRQLISKWGVMSIDLQTAFEADFVQEEDGDYIQAQEAELPAAQPEAIDAPEQDAPTEEQVSLRDL